MKKMTSLLGMMICCTAVRIVGAELTLNRFYSDNMVLQRSKPIVVRGAAEAGETVNVFFSAQSKTTMADAAGLWSVTLAPMPASAQPATLKVSSGETVITKENILVGDLILVARQASVDISLGGDEAGRDVAKTYKRNNTVRAIVIKTIPTATPQDDLDEKSTSGWAVLDEKKALELNAATFYMAQSLDADHTIPIGIVDLHLGYQFPISWLSRDALEETDKFYGSRHDVGGRLKYFDQQMAVVYGGEEPPNKFTPLKVPEEHATFPAGGYNAVLHPLRGLALSSAIIQLGNDYPYMIYEAIHQSDNPFDKHELNRAYVETYDIRKVGFRMESVTTPRIPREWRKTFGDDALPIGLIVPPGSDLSTFAQHNQQMRELQRKVAESNDGVDLIVPGMKNKPFSAQPQDEALLGSRCLQWLQGTVFDTKKALPTGPVFDVMEPHYNEATVNFKKGTALGLKAEGDALDYFEVAGVEGDYALAKASIDGDVIRIQSDVIPRIARVRYNWNDRPNEGLVNAAGLPAAPFRSEETDYHWFFSHKDDDLPEEYSTPANQWEPSDVTLVNGQMQTVGYDNFTGMIGPIGVHTGPFGPNMGVREVLPGSPAEGKVFEGDVIYSANGTMLGDKAWEVMGQAITQSETREGEGKLILGIRRLGQNQDVELKLEVMGSYSPTAPYDCPKTEKIVEDLNQWVWANGAGPGYLNNDALYMLGTGEPKLLSRVRQIVYQITKGIKLDGEIDPRRQKKSWYNSANAILLGEYYLATGDKTVLPYLKRVCDSIAATQNKEFGGWRHNFPGGATYGFIPNAGLPGVMGMYFADKAGLDINQEAYAKAVEHYSVGKAETGHMIYGSGHCRRETPPVFDFDKLENGLLSTYNGAVSAAGILMRLVGNQRASHMSSFISSYAWNMTYHGHGGHFWNNFWTPLGAYNYGKTSFVHFWKQYRWYREMNRMYHGGLIIEGADRIGAATGLPLVAPRRRIQIVGAPPSPFAVDAPTCLKPALDAHARGEYEECNLLVQDLLASGIVAKDEVETVAYLGRAALEWKESLTYDGELGALVEAAQPEKKDVEVEVDQGPERTWERLVAQYEFDQSKKKPTKIIKPRDANIWQMIVLEDMSQAPARWTQPDFDDSNWKSTTLPISWRMNHTALFRTTFEVTDPAVYDKLSFHSWVFRQQAIEISLNGTVIGKVNNIMKKTGSIENDFNDSALALIRKGTNTLTIKTRHNWRWGMLFMNVYNHGFDFNLDARLRLQEEM